LAALEGPQECVGQFRAAFERRRDLVVAGVARIPGLTLPPPEGAFYAYIGCAALIGRRTRSGEVLADDAAVARYLLHEGRVAAVPGAAYGLSPYFRISTATSDEILAEAVARIGAAVAQLETGQEAA
jgi:aspartate aminotransferase